MSETRYVTCTFKQKAGQKNGKANHRRCLFYKDGYILPEDLESWFKRGFIHPEDAVHTLAKDKSCEIFTVGQLLQQLKNSSSLLQAPAPHETKETELVNECIQKTNNEESHQHFCAQTDQWGELNKLGKTAARIAQIPLLPDCNEEIYSEDMTTDEHELDKMLSELVSLVNTIDRSFMNNESRFQPVFNKTCFGCSSSNSQVILTTKLEVFQHIFSEEHLQFLSGFGFSKDDFDRWKITLEGLKKGNQEMFDLFMLQISGAPPPKFS